MSLPTPNYVLTEEVTVGDGNSRVVLAPGTFVRPINSSYVPAHIKNSIFWFDPNRDEYCYTPKGILIIPKSSIRKL